MGGLGDLYLWRFPVRFPPLVLWDLGSITQSWFFSFFLKFCQERTSVLSEIFLKTCGDVLSTSFCWFVCFVGESALLQWLSCIFFVYLPVLQNPQIEKKKKTRFSPKRLNSLPERFREIISVISWVMWKKELMWTWAQCAIRWSNAVFSGVASQGWFISLLRGKDRTLVQHQNSRNVLGGFPSPSPQTF